MPLITSDELASWSGGRWQAAVPSSINGVTQNTRALHPGQLYVAIRGARHDGHRFLPEALAAGAAAALVDGHGASLAPAALPCLVVEDDTQQALGRIANGYRRRLGMRLVGVTGSVGKTTVKEMIAAMLRQVEPTVATRGNWNNLVGLPLSLLAAERSDTAGVFELGMSVPGEIAALAAIAEPDVGVMTPIGPVHTESFPSVDAIAAEKAALLASLPAHGRAIVWLEEPRLDILRTHAACPLVTVSAGEGAADYQSRRIDDDRIELAEVATGERVELVCPLPGDHNHLNLSLAVATCRTLGMGWGSIVAGLASFKQAPMRWECHRVAGATIINDAYNANPLSMRAALNLFSRQPCAGRRWLVLGGMLELGERELDDHLALGARVAEGPWHALLVVGNLGAEIARGAWAAGWSRGQTYLVDTAQAAASMLAGELQEDDAVLLKASRGFHLEVVLERLLERLGARTDGGT